MTEKIDLGLVSNEEATLDLFTTASKQVQPKEAVAKAERYDYALNTLSPGKESLYSDIVAGQEDMLRSKMVALEQAAAYSNQQVQLKSFVEQASANGAPLTDDQLKELTFMSAAKTAELVKDPSTYFEKKQAENIVSRHTQPETTSQAERLGLEKYLTRQYAFQNLATETNTRVEGETALSKVGNTLEQFISIKSWWTQRNAIVPTSSLLKGSNLQEQIQHLFSIEDSDEAITLARNAIDKMYESNPYDAQEFANALVEYSESDEFTANAFQAFNVATGVGATLAVSGVGKVIGLARSAGKRSATVPGMLDNTGHIADAALQTTVNTIKQTAENLGSRPGSFSEIAGEIDTIANPSAVLQNSSATSFSSEFARRLQTQLSNQSEVLLNANTDINNIVRMTPGTQQYKAAMERVQEIFNLRYPGLNNSIVHLRPLTAAEDVLSNVDTIAIGIGRNDGELFDTAAEGINIAKHYGMIGAKVKARGDKFYLEVKKNVDETASSVRNALQQDVAADPTPNSIANSVLGYLRTKDELLPGDINRDVKVATFGAQQLSNISVAIMQQAFKELPKRGLLRRNSSRQDFMSFLENQRDRVDPRVPDRRGHFSRDLHEFETDWLAQHNRLPSEDEATAYFTYTQVNDAEWFSRNLNIYKGKARLGLELFHFKQKGVKSKVAPTIEGRVRTLEDFNRHDDDAGVMFWEDGGTNSTPTHLRKNSMNEKERAQLDAMVNTEGYKIIQLSSFGDEALRQYPLLQFPKSEITYVIVKDVESSNLPLKQIPYRPGGHVNYAAGHYISQPKIRSYAFRGTTINEYNGDLTAMNFDTRLQAHTMMTHFNNARQALADGNSALARTLVERLPISFQDFTRMFDSARGGKYDVNTPFYARTAGESVHSEHKLDTLYDNFRDPTSSPHNVFNGDINMQYATLREDDIMTADVLGTQNNPTFNLRPARKLDPFLTMSRASAQIARGRYLDDLKIKSSERFYQEFSDVLIGDAETLQRYPMRALLGDNINKAHPDKERVAAARNYRRAMMEFWSIKHEDNRAVDSILNRVAERAITSLGETRGQALFQMVEPWMIPTLKDPTRFFRTVAFLPRMGFLNPKQLFLQASGVATTAAVEGLPRALKSMGAATLMRPLHMRGNDNILEAAADKAATLGWDKAHFKESYQALQRSGFQNVGGEYGTLDDFLNPSVSSSVAGKAMDVGLTPFKMGERANRLTAWNAAYLRWREANPLANFTRDVERTVLARADLLTINMTRASNAGFNQGWASIPTQFWSYQARLTDLMLGGRLKPFEKRRLMATYSALYGVPIGVFGTNAGILWPWHDQSRQFLIENGVDVNDPGWDAFTSGIPQAAINWATGGEVNPTLASTFGPGGLSFIRDFYTGDKSPLELAAGPAGKTVGSVLSAFSGLVRAGYGASEPYLTGVWATTQSDNDYLPLSADDFTPLIDNISTFSQGKKAYYAYTLGTYFTKNGIDKLDDTQKHPLDAVFSGVLGTDPQEVSDFYNKVRVKNGIEDIQKEERTEAIKNLQKANGTNISDAERIAYLKRAKAHFILGGFTERQKYSAIKNTSNNITEIEKIDRELKSANKERVEMYMNSLKGGK